MEEYLSQIKPNVGDTWRADELWLKVKGNMKYIFALMDDETRFWIAQEVGDTKYKHDAGNLFRKGKEAIGRVLSDDNGPVPVRRYCSVLVGSFAIISLFSFDR